MTIQIFKGVQNQELVSKADYDKLVVRLEMINALMDVAKEANENAKRGASALMEERDKLAVEGAMHREITVRTIGMLSCSGYEPKENSLNPAESLLFDALEASYEPNTDAAIADLKAQGVEEFKVWNDAHIEAGDEHEEPLREVSKACSMFAAKLRAGVKNA